MSRDGDGSVDIYQHQMYLCLLSYVVLILCCLQVTLLAVFSDCGPLTRYRFSAPVLLRFLLFFDFVMIGFSVLFPLLGNPIFVGFSVSFHSVRVGRYVFLIQFLSSRQLARFACHPISFLPSHIVSEIIGGRQVFRLFAMSTLSLIN